MQAAAGYGAVAEKVMTFAGGTTNDPGDYDGTGNPATLFTVTGTVLMKLFAVCETTLTGASATVRVGVANNTAVCIAQITATDLAVGEIWHDATPDATVELTSILTEKIIANGRDIVQTVATANITAGAIRYICIWKPLSLDGDVVAA
jgi:hypothetical protein